MSEAMGVIAPGYIEKVTELELARRSDQQFRFNTQKFFASMAAEIRRPHCGDFAKEYTRALLLRAQEAGLYDPRDE